MTDTDAIAPTPFQEAVLRYRDHCNIMNADINGDGFVDFGDINPFVGLLCGGGA